MTDQKQLFLFGQTAPGNNDANIFARMKECATDRNKNGVVGTKALEGIAAADILQMVVGNSHIAFLFKNNRVARLSFDIAPMKVEAAATTSVEKALSATSSHAVAAIAEGGDNSSSTALGQSSQSSTSSASASYAAAASAAANRTQKIRRVMMAARRPGTFCGRSGIVDRSRQLVPASSIPEELIAQAQVVLQGKSRDIIVRELQRTNLNVNEAVNNLLSRDEDEADELDETSEAYLHEELLSLLDASLRGEGSSAALIDHDNIYTSAEGYEYLVTRDLARRREESVKKKDRSGETTNEGGASVQEKLDKMVLGNSLEYWGSSEENEAAFPPGVTKFVKIASMYSELIALADDGKLYGWSWERKSKPATSPHKASAKLLGTEATACAKSDGGEEEERIIDIESCAWRAVVMTSLMRVGSFVDSVCGAMIFDTFLDPLTDIPDGESVEKLHACPLFCAVQTTNNCIYWRGVYPFNERRKLHERSKSRLKKHVTFDISEIKEGSEVRTKSSPIYAAGSIAINFTGGIPLVGTLMESAWTLNETCRFRVMSLEQYERQLNEEKQKQSERKVSFNISVRKRAAPSEPTEEVDGKRAKETQSSFKEVAWAIRDVVFIREEQIRDTAVVKIVDGAYCGIVYRSTDESGNSEGDDGGQLAQMRLMRKDDLVVVNPAYHSSRSPENFQRNFAQIHLPSGARRIIAMACDANGFRILIEKRDRAHLIRMSCLGKLLSDHLLPMQLDALNTNSSERSPTLENYGEESFLLLRDSSGNMVPLIRNAANGFKEPLYLGMGQMHDVAIGVRYLKASDELNSSIVSFPAPITVPAKSTPASKGANRLILVAALIAPSPEAACPLVPSLMQAILCSDLEGVSRILEQLQTAPIEVQQAMIVDARVDGNRNVLHAAVLNSMATTNRDQADVDHEEWSKTHSLVDTTEADSTRARYDRKWQEMLGTSPSKSEKRASKLEGELKKKTDLPAQLTPKERQANAIQIMRGMIKSPAIVKFLPELTHVKDIHGHIPLVSAIERRAYSAAMSIWRAMLDYATCAGQSSPDQLAKLVLPDTSRQDDNPLYVLCANDTCSFTWTGEEHINQDIFECRTCGLTGTLCCCTECAYTCHKNHDCKLKRTSPTAYCDCWEKSDCCSLVVGNTAQRENLLAELLNKTDLITLLNSRNEHLLLFLARTVARQLVEQDTATARNGRVRHKAGRVPDNSRNPEHDLEPPKFALKAFDVVLRSWGAVNSLLRVGMKTAEEEKAMIEDLFHLGEQHGSTHIDKFMFTLLARCQESHLDTFLNTLITEANRTGAGRAADIDTLLSRVVRSTIRLFILVCTCSPSATSIVSEAIANSITAPTKEFSTSVASSSAPKTTQTSYRAVAISGMLSLVSGRLPITHAIPLKEPKAKKALNNFILRTRRLFQALITYSAAELLNATDSLMAPVRMGMVKPLSISISSTSNGDVLDMVEKYLSTENDLSTLLVAAPDSPEQSSAKDGHQPVDDSLNSNPRRDQAESEPESDSDNDDQSSRPIAGQKTTQNRATSENERGQAASTRAPARSGRRYKVERVNSAEEAGSSEDSYTSASEGDEDEEEIANGNRAVQRDNERRARRSHSPERNEEEHREIEQRDEDDDEEEDHDMDEGEDDEDEEDETYGFNADEDYADEDGSDGEGGEVHPEDYSSEGENELAARRRSRRSHPRRNAPISEGEGSVAAAPGQLEGHHASGHEEERVATDGEGSHDDANADTGEPMDTSEALPEGTTRGTAPRTEPALAEAVLSDGQSSQRSDRARNENRANASTENASTVTATGSSSVGVGQRAHRQREGATAGGEPEWNSAVLSLSISFCVITKLLDELLLQLRHYDEWKAAKHTGIAILLKVNPSTVDAFLRAYEERLEPTWAWLSSVMDRTEAQLKYGNALIASPVGHYVHPIGGDEKGHYRVGKREERVQRRGKKRPDSKRLDEGHNQPSSRHDFLAYILSLMRSHSAENGDHLPIIESLRHISFVCEAFLSHVHMLDQICGRRNASINEEVEEMQTETAVKAADLRRFFERSKSISYPLMSAADPHHAFKYTANECLPLSTRAHLLQPEAEKNHLFAVPIPERTRHLHREVALAHGVKFPTNQSLAEPPLSFDEMIHLDEKDHREEPAESELQRPDVIVHSTEALAKDHQGGIDLFLSDVGGGVSHVELQRYLCRWCNATLFLSKAFHESLTNICGGDASLSVLLTETTGFHFRQMQFRHRMEKFKASQTKDLVLSFSQMSRDKKELFTQTIRQMNQQYAARTQPIAASSHSGHDVPVSSTLLASHKIKASFKDEPGEGSGVARSFYAAVAEALLTLQQLPKDSAAASVMNEEGLPISGGCLTPRDALAGRSQAPAPPRSFHSTRNVKLRSTTRQSAPPLEQPLADSQSEPAVGRIRTRSQRAAVLPSEQDGGTPVTHHETTSRRTSESKSTKEEETTPPKEARMADKDSECQPLFYKTSKTGYYNLIAGADSPFRLNVFRNVGRLIGICLANLEILPLPLCRHIYKFILGRSITWYDLAFYDPAMFDMLRSIAYDEAEDSSHGKDYYESLQLTFTVPLSEEEGGETVELKPGGENIPVTRDNVLEYIYLFVEKRLLGKRLKCLEAIRRGVFDVIPQESLANLTAEDLRLLLCGSQEISIPLLESYTKFSDESSASPETLASYKEWFWSVVAKLSPSEKQDLVFFWTGSPTLPSTDHQPLPTIMVRPADDHYLPTANTCISRLYLPLYSSKSILRAKLLLAIKAKNFGFV